MNSYITPSDIAKDSFHQCKTIKDIVLWHRKYTPWVVDGVIYKCYIPEYLQDGMDLKDDGASIPPRDLEENYKQLMMQQERLQQMQDGKKEFLAKYGLNKENFEEKKKEEEEEKESLQV